MWENNVITDGFVLHDYFVFQRCCSEMLITYLGWSQGLYFSEGACFFESWESWRLSKRLWVSCWETLRIPLRLWNPQYIRVSEALGVWHSDTSMSLKHSTLNTVKKTRIEISWLPVYQIVKIYLTMGLTFCYNVYVTGKINRDIVWEIKFDKGFLEAVAGI